MKISIIIVAYKSPEVLKRTLESIPEDKQFEVVMVDNSQHNRGFGKACNLAVKKAKGELLFFLNPDTKIVGDAINLLAKKLMSQDDLGIVVPQLLDDQKVPYLSFSRQPTRKNVLVVYSWLNTWFPNNRLSRDYWYAGASLEVERLVDDVSGAAMMMRKADFMAIGGFDERFFMYWEDNDLCWRMLKTGKQILYYPQAKIIHTRGGVTPERSVWVRQWFRRSRYLFFKKHFGKGYALVAQTLLVLMEEWRLILLLLLLAGLMIII
jgi:GT2 family glycosyltransferase